VDRVAHLLDGCCHEIPRLAASAGDRGSRHLGHTEAMLDRIEGFIRGHGLIEPGAEITCLV
jgi:hypothetical protein